MATWPIEPLISGSWKTLDADHVAKFDKIARKEKPNALTDFTSVAGRVLQLPFYDKGLLLELLINSNGIPYGVFRAILTRSYFVTIDGTSPAIHKLNSKRLKFRDLHDRLTYLHLFCSAVRGEEGRFRIIEEKTKIGDLESTIKVKPVEAKKRKKDDDTQRFSACIMYSDSLFIANLAVGDTGNVEMLDDEPLAADLNVKLEIFDRAGTLQLFDVFESPD